MTARVTAQALVEEQLVLAVESNPSDPQYLVALASFLGERKSRRKDAQVLLRFLPWFLSFVFVNLRGSPFGFCDSAERQWPGKGVGCRV